MQQDKSQIQELNTLLDEISAYSLKEISVEELTPEPDNTINIDDLSEILKKKILTHRNGSIPTDNILIIDVRTTGEHHEASIPFSVNLPILNDIERHKVGLIYTKHSQTVAYSLAYYYAKGKEDLYVSRLKQIIENKKITDIILHCWRGGGRSRYTANMLKKYGINCRVLNGGFKEFRRYVFHILYETHINVIGLSGKTGTGKSETLEYIKKNHPDVPVIHLEECAAHASSVFGKIRFINSEKIVSNQIQFEINLFMEMLPFINEDKRLPVFLTENESKKIGNFVIPPAIMNSILEENHIELVCSEEHRINRLLKDYFAYDSEDEIQKADCKEKVLNQLKKLNRKLGSAKIEKYESWIRNGEFRLFLEEITNLYYDRIYRKPLKRPCVIIENNDQKTVAGKILYFLSHYFLTL